MQNIDVLTQGLVTGINGLMNPNATINPGGASSSSGGQTPPKATDLVFTTFNQDVTSLAVGTNSGYKLYSLNSTDTLDPIYESAAEGVYIAERLFSSSLVAIVTQTSPRKLRVCHFKKGTEICNYSYTSKILAVKMNRARLVVCLEESLFIHNIRDMKVLHTIRETPSNKNGLCSLSTDSDNCYLAYPGHSNVGELQIFDALNLASISIIPAHTGQLAAIQFNPTGTRVATASDKGTVIRVFNVADGARVYELRRGLKRTATIYSLSFSPCGLYLACSSNTETVHVFKMDEVASLTAGTADPSSSPPGVNQGAGGQAGATGAAGGDGTWMGYLSNVVSVSANYLPTQVTDTLMQGRAFATVHHNLYGLKNICALAVIKKTLRLLLTSNNGYLYIYSLDTNEGGDCHLIRQFHVTSDSQQSSPMQSNPPPSNPITIQPSDDESPGAAASSQDETDSSPKCKTSEVEISYADKLRNRQPNDMTESEKFHEMAVATETPPRQCFLLDDDGDFPPVGSPESGSRIASSPPR